MSNDSADVLPDMSGRQRQRTRDWELAREQFARNEKCKKEILKIIKKHEMSNDSADVLPDMSGRQRQRMRDWELSGEPSARNEKCKKEILKIIKKHEMSNDSADVLPDMSGRQRQRMRSPGSHPLPQHHKPETTLASNSKTLKEKISSKSTAQISNPTREETKSRNIKKEVMPKTDKKVEKSDPKSSEAISPQSTQIKKVFQDLKPPSNKHVMLSYQHEFQPLVLQIRKQLDDSGYKTWMDVYDMGDNLIKGMQYGVENSAAFIMCMSESYQKSKNCQKEATYASEKLDSDDIIPIYVEKGFKATKWLEFVKTGILYMELTSDTYDDDFHKKLVNRLGKRGIK